MKILAIFTGKPKAVRFRGKKIITGFFKSPVEGPLMLNSTNLDGDGQADLSVHGGFDKALYAYPFDAYEAWKKLRPQDEFEAGIFGENLCMETLDEKLICLGDTFQLGAAVVQVTQPRFPCYKLGVRFEDSSVIADFMRIGRPGIYFRVLQEGMINAGDELKLLSREGVLVPVQEIFEMTSRADPERLKEILKVTSLNERMRKHYQAAILESL